MKPGYVSILANAGRRLYPGVTSDVHRRIWEHTVHWNPGSWTARFKATRLVSIAELPTISDAIAYEKQIRTSSHSRKVDVIVERNPRWNDLAWTWYDNSAIEATKRELKEECIRQRSVR